MQKRITLFYLLILVLITTSFTADSTDPKDYLNVGTAINFNQTDYSLVWSSNPTENYFKQEYLPEGATLGKHNDMFLVEVVKGKLTVDQAVTSKIQDLDTLKKANPVVKYNVYEKGKDKIIDFVLSDGAYIFEWNLYRYMNQKSKKGDYLVLYAYSYRDSLNTNADLKPFFGRIKNNRDALINKLGQLKLPKVTTD